MPTARYLDPHSIPLKRTSGGVGSVWATLSQITQGTIVALALTGLLLFFFPVIERTRHLHEEDADLQRRIAMAQEQQQQLDLEVQQLKNNPFYLEHTARARLNLARPGETIIRFDPYLPEPAPNLKPAHPGDNSGN